MIELIIFNYFIMLSVKNVICPLLPCFAIVLLLLSLLRLNSRNSHGIYNIRDKTTT
jgi:hypothetical protein